jgi:hypothetical protein
MISSYQLDMFARQAINAYLQNEVPLNESITKIAEEHALNKEQIARVIEAANTNTYIDLFEKSADKYVQFPTADPNAIGTELPKVAQVSDSDYSLEPPVEKVEIPENTGFEKVAEVQAEVTQEQIMRDYYRFKAAEAQLNNLLMDENVTFAAEADRLKDMIKQAVLSGETYSDVYSAVSSVSTDPVFTAALKAVEEELAPVMPINSMLKTAQVVYKTVNSKHPLIKQAQTLVTIIKEYTMLKEKLAEVLDSWELYKQGGVISGFKEIAQHPKAALMGVGIGTVGTAVALPIVAKDANKRKNSVLKSIPQGYAL